MRYDPCIDERTTRTRRTNEWMDVTMTGPNDVDVVMVDATIEHDDDAMTGDGTIVIERSDDDDMTSIGVRIGDMVAWTSLANARAIAAAIMAIE